MKGQLTLPVGLQDEACFANYFPGNNQTQLQQLTSFSQQSNETVLYLCGGAGSGRTHLLQACCHAANEKQQRSMFLPCAELFNMDPALLESLEECDLLCFDDVQLLSGNPKWQTALFHLFNRALETPCRLIVSSNTTVQQLTDFLPDLQSRLSWGLSLQLHNLSDEQKIPAMQLRAQRLGMSLNDECARYLLNHQPRDMHALFNALQILDKATLSAKHAITIPFIKRCLFSAY
jgi:DnaA-homolog protein